MISDDFVLSNKYNSMLSEIKKWVLRFYDEGHPFSHKNHSLSDITVSELEELFEELSDMAEYVSDAVETFYLSVDEQEELD